MWASAQPLPMTPEQKAQLESLDSRSGDAAQDRPALPDLFAGAQGKSQPPNRPSTGRHQAHRIALARAIRRDGAAGLGTGAAAKAQPPNTQCAKDQANCPHHPPNSAPGRGALEHQRAGPPFRRRPRDRRAGLGPLRAPTPSATTPRVVSRPAIREKSHRDRGPLFEPARQSAGPLRR